MSMMCYSCMQSCEPYEIAVVNDRQLCIGCRPLTSAELMRQKVGWSQLADLNNRLKTVWDGRFKALTQEEVND